MDDDILNYLLMLIPKDIEIKNMAEFPEFPGFINTYYHLSFLIPKNWTIIDFGAGYNAQSYFFEDHKEYIAINPNTIPEDSGMFCPKNCKIYRMTTKEFLENIDYPKGDKVFAICNYVPDWYGHSSIELVKKNFKNVYTFYPSR